MRYNPESPPIGGSRDGYEGMEDAAYKTDSDGNLNVFNVECNDDGRWLNGNNGNPDNFWNGNNRWVFCRPRNSLHFLSCFVGEFSFLSFPLHPPRFLPTSSTPCAIRIYCLLVSDLFSHNTSNNTCIVSSFRIAYRTYGNFSSLARNPAVATASIVSINNESIRHPNECRCGFGRMW